MTAPDTATSDLEALLDLVQSRGFQVFREHASRTWEDEFHRRVMEAIGPHAATPEQLALAHTRLQQAAAIREELRQLFRWPEMRAQQLRDGGFQRERAQQIEHSPRRRPNGL